MISAILVALVIWSAIQLGGQASVFGLVHLNFVATWSELPISNVNYYSSSNTFAKSVERYSFDWWLLLLDFFDFFIPGVIFMSYLIALRGSKNFLWVAWLYLIFTGIMNLLRFAWRFVQFSFCPSFGNICRSTNPANPSSFFQTDNLLWMTLFVYNGIFIFWLIVYAVLASKIAVQVEYDREDMFKQFLKRRGLSIADIELLITNARIGLFVVDMTGMPHAAQTLSTFNTGVMKPVKSSMPITYEETTKREQELPTHQPRINTSEPFNIYPDDENPFNTSLNPLNLIKNTKRFFINPASRDIKRKTMGGGTSNVLHKKNE